jgi:hypothetical protein
MDDREWLDSGLALSSVVYRLWSLSDFDFTLIANSSHLIQIPSLVD